MGAAGGPHAMLSGGGAEAGETYKQQKKIKARDGVPGGGVANRMVGVRIRQVMSGEVTADSCWILKKSKERIGSGDVRGVACANKSTLGQGRPSRGMRGLGAAPRSKKLAALESCSAHKSDAVAWHFGGRRRPPLRCCDARPHSSRSRECCLSTGEDRLKREALHGSTAHRLTCCTYLSARKAKAKKVAKKQASMPSQPHMLMPASE